MDKYFLGTPGSTNPAWTEALYALKEAKQAQDDALLNPVGRPTRETTLPGDSDCRKQYPLASGLLDYFPDALAAVANVSYKTNEKHNPGQAMHWSRKSPDHADTLMRHLSARGGRDDDGLLHSAKVAWRALALLQEELNPGKVPK